MISEPTRRRSGRTGSARNKRAAVLGWLEEAGPPLIGRVDFQRLRERFAPISETRLRRILRESGVSLDPLVEGVRQDSLEELERTLLSILGAYEHAPREARQAVITAKTHARFCMLRADDTQKRMKEEMILWMLTWLENPGLFPEWLELRKRAVGGVAAHR